jgi:stage II sporulation protein M
MKMKYIEEIGEFYRNLYVDNSKWFLGVTTLFFGTILIGLISYKFYPSLIENILQGFEEEFGATPALSFDLALQIFIQNIIASAIALFGGILLGLGSILVVGVNGIVIGYVVAWILSLDEMNLTTTLLFLIGGLVPHGIIEIPAFLIAATIGLRLGWEWMQNSSSGVSGKVFVRNLKNSFYIIPLILVMLFVAALIEVFVSGRIVGNL